MSFSCQKTHLGIKSKVYGGAFFQKYLMSFDYYLFLQKSFSIDIPLDSKQTLGNMSEVYLESS